MKKLKEVLLMLFFLLVTILLIGQERVITSDTSFCEREVLGSRHTYRYYVFEFSDRVTNVEVLTIEKTPVYVEARRIARFYSGTLDPRRYSWEDTPELQVQIELCLTPKEILDLVKRSEFIFSRKTRL